MGVFGAAGGSVLGSKLGKKLGGDGALLGALGGVAGSLVPFEKGGDVSKNTPAYLHKGEFVLPAHVKPTASQRAAVRKGGGRMKGAGRKGGKGKGGKGGKGGRRSHQFV